MFYLIVTTDKQLVKKAREMGAGVFTANKSPVIEPQVNEEKHVQMQPYAFLQMLAIWPNIQGHDFLRCILEKCVVDPTYHKQSLSKEIYPTCAEKFGTTDSKVQRAIRHALETSFRSAPEKYCEAFGHKFVKAPTNSEFISMASEYLKNY